MWHLVRKDIVVNRMILLIAAAMGLALVPISIVKPDAALIMALFMQLIFTHLIFTINRQSAAVDKESRLLLSLPVTRDRLVSGKYLFCLLCAVGYPAYLSVLVALSGLFGTAGQMPPLLLWALLSLMGLFYYAAMLPVSFISPRYATAAGLAVYFAILFIPQKLPAWLGAGEGPEALPRFVASVARSLQGWTLPVMGLFVIALGLVSMTISQRVYRKTGF